MTFKITAVISALAMGGSYVAWKGVEAGKAKARKQAERAQAWEDLEKDVPLIVGSKSPGREVIVVPEGWFSKDDEPLPPLMPSSKVGVFRLEKQSTQEEPMPVLPGSKSIGRPVFSQRDMEGALWRDKLIEVDEPIQVLPGSKSLTPIFRQEREEQP